MYTVHCVFICTLIHLLVDTVSWRQSFSGVCGGRRCFLKRSPSPANLYSSGRLLYLESLGTQTPEVLCVGASVRVCVCVCTC